MEGADVGYLLGAPLGIEVGYEEVDVVGFMEGCSTFGEFVGDSVVGMGVV